MTADVPSTHQKALYLNLDNKVYGSFAEIGAAQEVARWFFRVGAAAGTIAKTISAYDMQVSDKIYGEAGRYVSRERVESMLDKEYNLLVERLTEKHGQDTRFFAFCNTVSARNFAGTNECHGWMGLRFQSKVGGQPNTIILHINMLDDTNLAQQEAVGVLGVNMVYAAFFGNNAGLSAIHSLVDNISAGRLEADLIDASGPAFAGMDAVAAGMALVQSGLAEAILLNGDGIQTPPTEILRKRPAIIKRTSQRYASTMGSNAFSASNRQLVASMPVGSKAPLLITEFSINSVHAGCGSATATATATNGDVDVDVDRLLTHVRGLLVQNEWVMITGLRQSFRLSSYVRRYSQQPLRFVLGVSTLTMLFSERFYRDSGTEVLEAIGKLFTNGVKIYVMPMSVERVKAHLDAVSSADNWFEITGSGKMVSMRRITFQGPMQRLFQYLLESECIEELPFEAI
ncbi:MAG: hypothetical protein ACI8VR_001168 [Candidatus Azotimanducaceae bacterium]|jgi:hypothetical protein